jgi:hypothetical protein
MQKMLKRTPCGKENSGKENSAKEAPQKMSKRTQKNGTGPQSISLYGLTHKFWPHPCGVSGFQEHVPPLSTGSPNG